MLGELLFNQYLTCPFTEAGQCKPRYWKFKECVSKTQGLFLSLMGGSILSGKNAKCSESQSLLPTTNLANSDPVHSHFKLFEFNRKRSAQSPGNGVFKCTFGAARWKSDKSINNRTTLVLRDGKWTEDLWYKVEVGDLVKLKNNDAVPGIIKFRHYSNFRFRAPLTLKAHTARWKSDKSINNRTTLVLRDGKWTEDLWYKVEVGDLVKLKNNDAVPADMLLISTSAPNGLGFIETAELDGETNLKVRQSLVETEPFLDDVEKLSNFYGKPILKRTNVDKLLNRIVYYAPQSLEDSWFNNFIVPHFHNTFQILGLLLVLCVVCGIGSFIWESIQGQYFAARYNEYVDIDTPILIAVLRIPSYIIVLNTLVPISLYVSVEMIRLGQSFFINWDIAMYHNESDTPAKARSTALNEELGQIKYVFSDKTGTLTQNVMVFLKGSINGVVYGDNVDDSSENLQKGAGECDFSWNRWADPKFTYSDQNLLKAVQAGDEEVDKYFKVLSLCHTVMSEYEELPREVKVRVRGLLLREDTAARNFGYVYKSRTQQNITMELNGEEEDYELLALLDKLLQLFCKGADTTVIPLINKKRPDLLEVTLDHMNVFARTGLRTLIIAMKDISDADFQEWYKIYEAASIAMTNRDEKVAAAYDLIESDLDLVGSTAIEDKLQDGVPETIANLARASIKIWVLTGDKQVKCLATHLYYKLKMNVEVVRSAVSKRQTAPS
eukprot:sb/3462505/